MSIFNIRQWLDRISEHPNRRTLTNVEDQTDVKTYDLSRAEGEVSVQGTALTAANLNDLESRIASAFTAVENAMPEANPAETASGSLTKLKVNGTVYEVEGTEVEKGTIQNVAIASFSDGADNVPVSYLIVAIDAVQAGSGTPSPSNPRPISGFSALNVTRTGKNLCFDAYGNKASESTYLYPSGDNLPIIVNNTLRTAYAHVGKNQDVVVSFASAPQRSIAYGLEAYPASGVICHSLSVTALSSTSFKLNSGNYDYIAFYYCNDLGNIPSDCQIELGSTATAYEEFNGVTDTIDFGQTVYGGSLNVKTGELTITHGIKTFDGTLSYTMTGDGKIVYCDATPDAKVIESNYGQTTAICDHFRNETNSASIRQGTVDMSFNIGSAYFSTTPRTVFRNSNWTSVSDAINFFSDNPTQIVYELATPITIHLTPTEVRSLLNCNIFADTGDINELVYFKTGCETIARLIEAYECYIEVAGTLAAGQTSITLTNDAITLNSTIDVYTDADVDYTSISVATGSVTITFDAQASNMKVKVRLS